MEVKAIKPDAIKMRERTQKSRYTLILKKVAKEADKSRNSLNVLPGEIDLFTLELLNQNEFKVEEIDLHNYKAFKISWNG